MDSPDVSADGKRRGSDPEVRGEPGAMNGEREAWSGLRALRIPLVIGLAIALFSVYLAGDWRNIDVSFYHTYALAFWGGIAHPLFPPEYPPLSILPFSLSLAGPASWYPDVFAFWMALLFALGYLSFRHFAGSRQAGAYAIYLLAAGPATLLFRYDLFPALLVVAAVWLLQRKRFAAVYPLLAAGTLLKLFPLLVLPIAAVAHWRSGRGKDRDVRRQIILGIGACLGIIAVGFLGAVVIDHKHGLGALTYNFRRPIEVESVPATVLWLGSLVGIQATATASYGSFNLVGSLSAAANMMGIVALVTGLLWVYWRNLRGQLTTQQATVAALLVVICTSKVLSAQYLIWVAPLLAATVGFQMRWLFLCLMTALVFPVLFEVGVSHQGSSIAFSGLLLAGIAARNTLLLILTARFLIAPGAEMTDHRHSAELALATMRHGQPSSVDTTTLRSPATVMEQDPGSPRRLVAGWLSRARRHPGSGPTSRSRGKEAVTMVDPESARQHAAAKTRHS
jgi:hypothetical protein